MPKLPQNFQEHCEKKLQLLDEAAASAAKMTVHTEADAKVTALKSRCETHCSVAGFAIGIEQSSEDKYQKTSDIV